MEVQWWSAHLKAESFATKLKRLVLSTTIWHPWQERNSRIFKQANKTNVQLVATIMKIVQLNCVSWESAPRTRKNLELVLEWGLDHRCLMS